MDGSAVPSPGGKLVARNATPETLISNLEDATAIDFLYEEQYIFWTAANLVVSSASFFFFFFFLYLHFTHQKYTTYNGNELIIRVPLQNEMVFILLIKTDKDC